MAAACLWVLSALTGQPPWRLERRAAVVLAAMGLTLYSLQAFSFIFAVASLPASLVSLVLYSYPSLVAIGARIVFGRALTPVHVAALAASFLGVALLVGGVGGLRLTGGLFFAALAPVVYTVYILAGDHAMRRTGPGAAATAASPIAAATVVMTGSAITFTAIAALGGDLRPPATAAGAAVLVVIGLLPTVAAITLVLAALPRIGAGRTALLSSVEPAITVALAAVLLGERLAPVQAVGALLVLGAVAVIQWPRAARPAQPAPVRSASPPR